MQGTEELGCCYITMDFAMAASLNGVRLTQQLCHTYMDLFPTAL
jgi:hypothetical protein